MRKNLKGGEALRRLLIGVLFAAILASFVGSAFACVGDGLSPGFWKHNVGVKLELRKGGYSNPPVYPGMTPVVTKDTMDSWLDQWTTGELTALYDMLNTKGGGWAGAQIRIDAANVFNLAADLTMYG